VISNVQGLQRRLCKSAFTVTTAAGLANLPLSSRWLVQRKRRARQNDILSDKTATPGYRTVGIGRFGHCHAVPPCSRGEIRRHSTGQALRERFAVPAVAQGQGDAVYCAVDGIQAEILAARVAVG